MEGKKTKRAGQARIEAQIGPSANKTKNQWSRGEGGEGNVYVCVE